MLIVKIIIMNQYYAKNLNSLFENIITILYFTIQFNFYVFESLFFLSLFLKMYCFSYKKVCSYIFNFL